MLSAVVYVGADPPLEAGIEPAVVAHLHENGLSRFLAYELGADGTLDRVPGAYAPDPAADPSYPVTDLLLALYREGSAVGERLDVLSTKAEANYGVGFREKIFDSDVEADTDGYGRHFEARSQLEAHPFEAVVAVGTLPGIGEPLRAAIAANLDRLDAPIHQFDPL